jgi:hypothetical protein
MSVKALDTLFFLARLGAAAALTLFLAGMLAPVTSLPPLLPSDLLLHAVGSGAPTILACFAATSRAGRVEAVALIAVAGLIAELAQGMVPCRTVSALDLMANAVGIGCGAWLGWLSRAALGEMFRHLSASRSQS